MCEWPGGCESPDAQPAVLRLHEADNVTHLHAYTNELELKLCAPHTAVLVQWLQDTPLHEEGVAL